MQKTENHGRCDEQHGNGCGSCAVVVQRYRSVCSGSKAVEGAGNHGGEGCDDEKREQPAEQGEEASSFFADVLLNDHSDGFSIIFDGGIQGTEILYGAEEDTADEEPEENRHPAENGCKDRALDRTGTCNGGELMREDGQLRGRNIVLSVLVEVSWPWGQFPRFRQEICRKADSRQEVQRQRSTG